MSEEIRTIHDRFRIDSLIARGGMARVYKGTDLTLARTVAIKVLSEELATDPQFLMRFRREAQAAASLTHPNIVAVYDTGEEGGLHYIVMEYVEGQTLVEILDKGTLSPERAADIGADVALALAAAHDKGIVHRDIKPANIMVSEGGLVKVMDFGIAKAATAGALTQVGSILGTVSYLSPEQARGEDVDFRSDIYSLGALVYQMVCGRPPFAAENLMEMVNKLNKQNPTAPSVLNPAVPEAMEGVILKALSKDPDRRQQSASQLAEELSGSLHGDPAATAAYVGVPVDEGFSRDRTMVAPAFDDDVITGSHTEVIRPVEERRESTFPTRIVAGAMVVVALAILVVYLMSNMGNPQVGLTDPTNSPSRTRPAEVVQPGTRPQATTVPPTTVTEPPTEPPTEPDTEPPTEPPTDPPAPEDPGDGNNQAVDGPAQTSDGQA